MFNDEQIIQLTINQDGVLYGLSNRGRLFYWNKNILAEDAWTLYQNV